MARRILAVAAAMAVVLGVVTVSSRLAAAAAPTVPITGTVRGHTEEPLRTAALSSGFAVATTECAEEERRLPAPNGAIAGLLMPVAADGTYAGSLVAGCIYDTFALSVACGSRVDSLLHVTVTAGADGAIVDHLITFANPAALAPEPEQDVSPATTLELLDGSRPVDLWPCTFNAARSIPTSVFLPGGPGPHPMIVVAHGLGSSRTSMQGRGTQLAAAGYVVVIPSFASRQSPLAARDLVNQPGDVSFVIREVLRRNNDPLHPLYGQVNPDRIGISGVSGGAITALLFFNGCCREPRIKAIHAEMGFFLNPPAVAATPDFKHRIPLLMANNRGDGLIPFPNAAAGWQSARADKYLVSEPPASCGQSHCLPTVGGLGLIEFFDAYLQGDQTAKDWLRTTFSQPDEAGVEWDLAVGGKGKASS